MTAKISSEQSSNDWRNWPTEKLVELLATIENRLGSSGTDRSNHPRQQEFLELDCEEALYGGAVGGGKTEALLEWHAQGVNHANYSGLFLRRTFSQLTGSPTAPIERSYKFFAPLGGRFNATEKVWKFPNGAMIRFGHMQHETDKHNYDGHEYHRCTVDQIEQFSETQYTYMFSRLRRTKDFPLPCGMRSSANPVGGNWVKQRFVTDEAIEALKGFTAYDPTPSGMMFTAPNGAIFCPARIADNPSLEVDEYIERLRGKLGAVLAAKLANGDWSVVEGAIIDADQLRYYSTRGEMIVAQVGEKQIVLPRLTRFATIDTAGSSKQKAEESRGKPPSWSVCAIWDHDRTLGLFLRAVWRKRVEWPELKSGVKLFLRSWAHPLAIIENAHHGPVLKAELRGSRLINTKLPGMGGGNVDNAKHDRAVASGLLTLIESGRFWLPDVSTVEGAAGWMPEFESELLSFTGAPDQTADQVDVASYAAYHIKSTNRTWGGVIDSRKVGAKR